MKCRMTSRPNARRRVTSPYRTLVSELATGQTSTPATSSTRFPAQHLVLRTNGQLEGDANAEGCGPALLSIHPEEGSLSRRCGRRRTACLALARGDHRAELRRYELACDD